MRRTAKLIATYIGLAMLALLVSDLAMQRSTSFAQGAQYLTPCQEPLQGVSASTGCNGNDCRPDIAGCSPLEDFALDLCCVDLDGDRRFHCAQCIRYYYKCVCGGRVVVKLGPYSECLATRQRCTP
jgi:hypothetical protein